MGKVYYEKSFEPCSVKCAENIDDFDYYTLIRTCKYCNQKLIEKSEVSEVFFIMRQWKPNVQKNLKFFVDLLIDKHCGIDDRDGVTDMTMLMYACKSGGIANGNDKDALELVKYLVEDYGAEINVKSNWLDMNCYHICAFFDCYKCLDFLLNENYAAGIDAPCEAFDRGSALHLACMNKCIKSAHKLIKHGANINYLNTLGLKPFDYVKNGSLDISADMSMTSQSLDTTRMETEIEFVLQKMNLKINDRVLVSNKRIGTLRYCGTTQFANGIWAGVELDKASGKHDGSLCGIRYFTCDKNHGIFCQLDRIKKATVFDTQFTKSEELNNETVLKLIQSSDIYVNNPTSLTENKSRRKRSLRTRSEARTAQKQQQSFSDDSTGLDATFNDAINVGTKILYQGHRATIRYVGKTHFGEGTWLGLELKSKNGKNDGTIQGVKYFECEKRHGIFVKAEKLMDTFNRPPKTTNSKH